MSQSSENSRLSIIRIWLLIVAALVVGTLIVGGATRLTESGLSIVEWKPVTGVLPPLTEAQWTVEFDKYKQIPQYREVNRGMSLSEFKTIFWWEWAHRLLGRTIGVVFALPFLFFLWRGWVGPGLRGRLWLLFFLGGAQGAVGWWMVSSGLAERVSVSQYRLAFHMTLACVIYAAIIWTVTRLKPITPVTAPARLRTSAGFLVVLTLIQIYLGALVAGLDAGMTYNTWPLIDGAFVPAADRLWFETPLWRNLFENTLTVQFNHRMMAYLLLAFGIWHAIDVTRGTKDRAAKGLAHAFAFLLVVQAGIGIMTLLLLVPMSLALLHQAMAIVLLTIATIHASRLLAHTQAAVPLVSVKAGTQG
ncbi:COX15/CtaA family protein [Pseudorhodoplanes sinuspersici]|uniref:Heme A synthase n=1 Tax=Pseudorhodoplanes sinuspersici TaxID=1235591 RepID=A0A1W7A0N2_9HYPH|nr:COX15/CtaA family protein [Pseudorhodoplanes sinuspersici]ARQ03126.1 heme A synthase [Pseudorhodoplanes sinuspersici]RKE73293.1 cytochrome c oxidase assembly protein subunit 15 [Pseudorhodoplanes sinuspersici]